MFFSYFFIDLAYLRLSFLKGNYLDATINLFWLQKRLQTQINRTMTEQLMVVTMTGFLHDPREEQYKQMITNLGMRLATTLSEETCLLIVKDVTSQKYKIAKLYTPEIATVSVQWLLESHRANRIQKIQGYLISQIFFGASVCLLDFDKEKSARIAQKINQKGGQARIIPSNTQLGQMLRRREKIRVIVTTNANFMRMQYYLQLITFPVVSLEWLQDSFRGGYCKYPNDYALNLSFISPKEAIDHYRKMKNKLQVQLGLDLIKTPTPNLFLQDTIIYFPSNVNKQLAELLKKLVMVHGGFYLQAISPVATHILTQLTTQSEYNQLKVFGNLTHVLRVTWIIDSIYLQKRLPQEDYTIRSFKPKNGQIMQMQQRTSGLFNSQSFGSLPVLANRNSISAKQLQQRSVRQIRPTKKYQSNIFKGKYFYIQSNQKKQTQLSDLQIKIVKNGGFLFNTRNAIKANEEFLYVLKDSPDCLKYIAQLKTDLKITGQSKIQPISYRWLNQCLSKGHFIDYRKTDSFIYKPFNFKTPIMGFHKIIFDVLGVDEVLKLRLKQLYNTFGSGKNAPNRAQLTHCLCGQKYAGLTRYEDIKRDNKTVKFVKWQWLLQCANSGKIVDLGGYLMQDKQKQNQVQNLMKKVEREVII